MEAEIKGGNATTSDYVIDIHDHPLRFYGFSYDNVTQFESLYSEEDLKRRLKALKKEKRRKLRRRIISVLAAMVGTIVLILIYYIYATRTRTPTPKKDWWYVWLRKRLGQGMGSIEEVGDWRGDMIYVNKDPGKAQEGKQPPEENKSSYWGAPSLTTGNYTLACKNTEQGKSLVADDRGYVCKRELVMGLDRGKKGRGCCPPPDEEDSQFSCKSCGGTSTPYCCTIYEYCVACCLSPEKTSVVKDLLLTSETPQQAKRLLESKQDRFEVCSALCRSSSKNLGFREYLNPAKHCYGPVPSSASQTKTGGEEKT